MLPFPRASTVETIYGTLEDEWAAVIGHRRLEAVRNDLTAMLEATHGGRLPTVRPTP